MLFVRIPDLSELDSLALVPLSHPPQKCSQATWLKCKLVVIASVQMQSSLEEVALFYVCRQLHSISQASSVAVTNLIGRHFSYLHVGQVQLQMALPPC